MREFRRKQKQLKRIMNVIVIATAILLLALIGTENFIVEALGKTVALGFHYVSEIMVIASLAIVLFYYSKYGKTDTFLTNVEHELSDCGYYKTKRTQTTVDDYYKAVREDLISGAFAISENLELTEMDFALRGTKRGELFYVVNIDELDKNDVIAHLDSVVYDITAVLMKRTCNAVLLFICDKADDEAVSLSKSITTMGKKDKIKIAMAIAEVSTNRVYFLGNNPTKCQQMIATYVMDTEMPIEDSLKGERLPFQDELEEHMKDFDLNEYRRGNFFSH